MNWTNEQKNIHHEFQIGRGHVTIEARAGSGKTSTIAEGLKRIPEKNGFYGVFNKKLQIEAAQKITNPKIKVQTLHSLGFSYVLQNWRKVRAGSATEFYRVQAVNPEMPAMVQFQTARLVSYLKNTILFPNLTEAIKTANDFQVDAGNKFEAEGWTVDKLAETALKVIEKSKEYSFNISYEDMIWLPNVMGWTKKQFDFLCLDEAQDLNEPQLKIAIDSCGGRMILVGDSWQKIYGFRGALNDAMGKFKTKLDAKELTLTTSFRCPRKVISAAQAIVPDIKASDTAIDGEVNNLNEDSFLAAVKPLDVVLSRTNAPLVKQCLAFIRKGIPAYIEGREMAKTLIDLMHNIGGDNVNDFIDKLILWQGIQVAKPNANAKKLDLIADQVSTFQYLSEGCLTLKDMENKINSLFFDADYVRKPSIILSTVHKFKGCEADNVFALQDSFASRRQMTEDEAKEERNIMYVAITRARQTLNWVALNAPAKVVKKS